MRTKVWFGAMVLMVIVLLLGAGNISLGWGNKTKQPSPEIISATQKALEQRVFDSEEAGDEDKGKIRYVVMYIFDPKSEQCEICSKDMQNMFTNLLFQSELLRQGQISLLMITEADKNSTIEFLTNILAPIFNEQKVEANQIDALLKSINLVAVAGDDLSDYKAAKLPIIAIIDTTLANEEDEGNLYLSSGAAGPWSKFDQLIQAKSTQ